MIEPSCYVIGGAEWRQFLNVLAWAVMLPPFVWWALQTDWPRWVWRWRVLQRCLRLRVIRDRRSGSVR